MKKRQLPKYVHKKTAKGKTYYYFDTGIRDDAGKRILSRLPDIRDRSFGTALQTANGQRSKRKVAKQPKTFDWLCKLYERSPEWQKLSPATKSLYSLHLRYASQNFRSDSDGSWPVEIITAEHALSLRDKYADRPGTANVILKALGSLYKWATNPGRKYAEKSIIAGIEQFDMGEHEPWPEWLIEEALNDPEVRLPVALLYYLGQRIGDTVRLGPQNIARGVCNLTQQKTGTALSIPFHSRLAKIIETDAPKGAMLFMLNERNKPMTEPALRIRLQKWARARGQEIVPHGLRKNAVIALLEAECSVAEVSAITGQSMQMVEHYAKKRNRGKLAASAILKFEARDKTGTGGERENRS
jgi:integrase